MPRTSYPEPVVPGKFSSRVTKKTTTERVRDWRTGQTSRRTVDCWDVQGRADGGDVGQTVPVRRLGQDLDGALRRRLRRRSAVRSTGQAVRQPPRRSASPAEVLVTQSVMAPRRQFAARRRP
jgi:hypothetical protein